MGGGLQGGWEGEGTECASRGLEQPPRWGRTSSAAMGAAPGLAILAVALFPHENL